MTAVARVAPVEGGGTLLRRVEARVVGRREVGYGRMAPRVHRGGVGRVVSRFSASADREGRSRTTRAVCARRTEGRGE